MDQGTSPQAAQNKRTESNIAKALKWSRQAISQTAFGSAAFRSVKAFGPTGTPDDSATYQAGITACPPLGVTLWQPAISSLIHVPLHVVPDFQFRGSPDASLQSTIPYVDGFSDCLFSSNNGNTIVTTLAADVVLGSWVFVPVTTAGIVLGGYGELYRGGDAARGFKWSGIGVIGTTDVTNPLLYGGGGLLTGETLILDVDGAGFVSMPTGAASATALQAAIAAQWPALRVVQVGGPGPAGGLNLVLTAGTSLVVGGGTANALLGLLAPTSCIETDVPIVDPFKTGDSVTNFTTGGGAHGLTSQLHWDFQGETLAGTGGRTMWLAGCWDSTIENFVVQNNWTIFGPDFDIGSRRAHFLNALSIFDGVPGVSGGNGFALEGGQSDVLEDLEARGGFNGATNTFAHGFNIGFQIAGTAFQANRLTAHGCVGGILLMQAGPLDIFAARYGHVDHSYVDGCSGSGAGVLDASTGNTFSNSFSDYNAGNGFVALGTASYTTFLNDTAIGNGGDGFSLLANSLQTSVLACRAAFNARGIYSETPGTYIGAARTVGNSLYGIEINGVITTIEGHVSVNDVQAALISVAAAHVTLSAVDWTGTATVGGWAGWIAQGTSRGSLCGGEVQSNSDGATIFASAVVLPSGTPNVTVKDLRVSGCNAAIAVETNGSIYLEGVEILAAPAGSVGLYAAAGTSRIGPNCAFDVATTPIDFAGGAVTMCQTGGIATPNATRPLTFAEHYTTAIEYAAAAAADGIITTYPIPGMQWVANNLSAHNLTVKTSSAATVVVPAGKKAIVAVNSAGDIYQVDALL